jgi:hypothetical protein
MAPATSAHAGYAPPRGRREGDPRVARSWLQYPERFYRRFPKSTWNNSCGLLQDFGEPFCLEGAFAIETGENDNCIERSNAKVTNASARVGCTCFACIFFDIESKASVFA